MEGGNQTYQQFYLNYSIAQIDEGAAQLVGESSLCRPKEEHAQYGAPCIGK